MSAPVQPVVHTPEPWRTARGFSTSPPIALPLLIVRGQGKDCRTLAVIVPDGTETEEDIANAAIMSRAPQMLACLKRMQVALGEFCCLNCITEDDLHEEGLDLLEASKEIDRIIADIEVV
jgi:hypothetical protein